MTPIRPAAAGRTPARPIALSTTALGLIFAALPALAQETDGESVLVLDTITVTAGGFEQSVENAPASVTVIPGEELQRQNVTDLTDILTGVQGVATTGTADESDIFIRGLPGDYTLILVDGRRQGTRESRPNGSSGFEQSWIPPVAAIERVEVVRGPMSSLYGSDAMGGVINIITKKISPVWTGSLTLEGTLPEHSRDGVSAQQSFYLAGPVIDDKLGVQLWGRRYWQDESGVVDGAAGSDDEDLTARLVFAPVDGHEFQAEVGRTRVQNTTSDGESVEEGDGDAKNRHTREHWMVGYRGEWGAVDADLSFQQETGKRTTWSGDADESLEKSDREPEIKNSVLDAKFTAPFSGAGEHTLVFGGQYFDAELTDQNSGTQDSSHQTFSAYQWALFAEDEWRLLPDFALTLGARYTEHENFGGYWTPRLYGVWNATGKLTVKGGVSTGYKAPGIRQTTEGYYYATQRGQGVIVGDPDLEPETSTSYELGAIWTEQAWQLSATAYHTDFTDKIESYNTGETIEVDGVTRNRWEYVNVQDATVQGVELAATWETNPYLSWRATYTYTDSEQESGDYKGLPLARTPEHQASLRGDWKTPVSGLDAWGRVTYHGEEINAGARIGSNGTPYKRNADGDVIAYKYDAYTTVDIGASYAVNETLTLNAAIYNLTDKEIASADNNTVAEGRSLWLGLTATF
ncbi:TonB-dependent receptor domain-containing protein [Poseidonocella sp. HB161398]|uniref:TonB-dependent receptor domain-containing protein n=1 Tax=Poseidonocella sp. HB161398 TaxID=2320855 RepID=UPI001107BE1C|nr:TonB-dependent receptor [Poseidonocella sp. HB161398]